MYKLGLAGLSCHHTLVWNHLSPVECGVAPQDGADQLCWKAEPRICSEKQKQRDAVVFLLLRRFIEFTSCDELHHLVHFVK